MAARCYLDFRRGGMRASLAHARGPPATGLQAKRDSDEERTCAWFPVSHLRHFDDGGGGDRAAAAAHCSWQSSRACAAKDVRRCLFDNLIPHL